MDKKISLLEFLIDERKDKELSLDKEKQQELYIKINYRLADEEIREEFNQIVCDSIAKKLPLELIKLHFENQIPLFSVQVDNNNKIIISSFYLGFLAEETLSEIRRLCVKFSEKISSMNSNI